MSRPAKTLVFTISLCSGRTDNIFLIVGGKNTGLTIAEIELKSEDEAFEKPEWLKSVNKVCDEYIKEAYTPIEDKLNISNIEETINNNEIKKILK